MIRLPTCWQVIAYLIGWLLGWLGSTAYPAGWPDVTVRVENRIGSTSIVGSGTLAAGDGRSALVVTCQHLFREGVGSLVVERASHQRYAGRLLGRSRYNDIAAIEIDDPGVRTLRLAPAQATAATMIGWGETHEPSRQSGQLVEHAGKTVFYDFQPEEGDSGGGVFDGQGRLMGVVWGTTGSEGAVVPLADLRAALDGPACRRYWRQTSTTKEASPMFATPIILAAGMLAQLPPMPDKTPPAQQLPAPRKIQPSPQGRATPQSVPYQTQQFIPAQEYEQQYAQQYQAPQQYQYVPQRQSYDLPVTIRLRVTPEVEIQAQQAQTYAAAPRVQYQQQAATYSGGGCYGGSFSAGSYGVSQRVQVYEAPVAFTPGCPSGLCGDMRGAKIKVKNKVQTSGRGGLLGLSWFARQ